MSEDLLALIAVGIWLSTFIQIQKSDVKTSHVILAIAATGILVEVVMWLNK